MTYGYIKPIIPTKIAAFCQNGYSAGEMQSILHAWTGLHPETGWRVGDVSGVNTTESHFWPTKPEESGGKSPGTDGEDHTVWQGPSSPGPW